MSDNTNEWLRIERHPILCDLCAKPAEWAHPVGGLRCGQCPRPNEHWVDKARRLKAKP